LRLVQCDVVVVAPVTDLHAKSVVDAIKRRGGTVAQLSLRHLLAGNTLSIHGEQNYSSTLRIGDADLDLNQVKSIWWRRTANPEGSPTKRSESWFRYQEWQSFIFSLEVACGCNWVNSPTRQWLARRKALQMAIASGVGLRTPATLITNDAEQVREFRTRFPRTIYKTMGDTPHRNMGTRFLSDSDLGRLDTLASCPAIFQEFIEASSDIRVTVIRDEMFAVRIDSQSGQSTLDWRFDHSVDFHLIELEAGVAALIARLMSELGLIYGAIDLRQTPEGEYVFLEVNPAGQYLFVELLTGAKISESMARELLLIRR
jgi:glutathione synthase/RimK-type ligase-like ATP-grasp enzyme/lambda repressor-like predicted transcriptional regulator